MQRARNTPAAVIPPSKAALRLNPNHVTAPPLRNCFTTSNKRRIARREKKHLLYTANDDLCQRIDQGLHDLAGVDRAENPTPEIEAVDVLPVVDRLEVLLQKKDEQT